MSYPYAIELHHNFHSSEICQHRNRFGFQQQLLTLDFQKYLAVSLITRTGDGDEEVEKIYYHRSSYINSISVYRSIGYNQPELIGEVVPTYEEDGTIYAWTASHHDKLVSKDFEPSDEVTSYDAEIEAVNWIRSLTP